MGIIELLILFFTIMDGFTISGLIGFGGNVLAMPILSIVFSIKDIVLAFAAISFVNSMVRFIQYRKDIIWKRFIFTCIYMLIGSVVGLIIYKVLPETVLKFILGLFIIIMSIYNFLKKDSVILEKGVKDLSTGSFIFYHVILFLGGIMQGAFVCGGPLLVIYCNHYFGYKRQVFLGMQWGLVFFNALILIISNTSSGAYRGSVVIMSIIGIISLIGSFLISGWFSKKVSDKGLRTAINVVLIVSGLSTSIQAMTKLII